MSGICDYCGQDKPVEFVIATSRNRRRYNRERDLEERVRWVVKRRNPAIEYPQLCGVCYGRFQRREIT